MSYQVFARKYRPRTFGDVLGQDHVVQTLRNAIEKDRLAHAYLFVGPRGTGKTSTARIFAKALNCPGGPKVDFDPDDPVCREIAEGNCLDVLEIDGASNNGVEQVRELRETVKYAPAHCKYKIYYIDEVHMLSTPAFNALLKTLEEPPAHVKFIFATTEPSKILPTIISRCQRFDLRRIPTAIIAGQLLHIARQEGVDLDEAAAYAVAKGADGGMRDAQSMLDQLVAFRGKQVREADVLDIFGFTSMDFIADLADSLLARQTVAALEKLHEQSQRGKDLLRLMGDLIAYLRNLLVAQIAPGHQFADLSPETVDKLRAQTGLTTADRLLNLVDHFAETEARMKWAASKELHFEVGLIKGMQILSETNLSDVIGILRQAGETAGGRSADSGGRRAAGAEPEPTPGRPRGAAKDKAPAATSPAAHPADAAAQGETERAAMPVAEQRAICTNLRGSELWAAVLRQIATAKPLMWGWARSATFLEEKPRQLVIGFPPRDSFSRDSLMREKTRTYIEELILRFGGRSLSLDCELREGLETVPDSPGEGPPGGEDGGEQFEKVVSTGVAEAAVEQPQVAPKPARKELEKGAKRSQSGKASLPAPAAAVPLESQPVPPLDETAFRDDELIREALRLFEGELEEN